MKLPIPTNIPWSYREAFQRNQGIIGDDEQAILKNCRVAIAGMGGVGGEHLLTLVRLGVGKFTIADPDSFEVANFNRQAGGSVENIGKNKAQAMAQIALGINPDLDIRIMPVAIDATNVNQFLEGVDLFVDGFDAFAIDARRLTFAAARKKAVFGIGAGPVGFSTVWVTFDPSKMEFDSYFNIKDTDSTLIKNCKYLIGMAPSLLHRSYLDRGSVSIQEQRGPSVAPACKLATGVLGVECVKILLGRGKVRVAPYYHQYDAYNQQFVKKRLSFLSRTFLLRLKLWWVLKTLCGNSSGTELDPANSKFTKILNESNRLGSRNDGT